MQVLQILPYLNQAGTELHVLALSKGLKQKGHEVTICAPPGPLAGRIQEEGLHLRSFRSLGKNALLGAKSLITLIKGLHQENPVDLIHVHAGNELLLPVRWAVASLKPRPRTLFTVHSFFGRAAGFDYWLAAKLGNILADGVIAVSKEEGRRLQRAGLPKEKMRVIHNGVERPKKLSQQERNELRKKFGSENEIILGTIGRLEKQKGYDLLLQTLQGIRQERADVRLVIFGSGREQITLENLAAELELSDAVHFAGFQPDASTLIQAADAFVSASRLEGLSLAVIEAMAAGLPCFVTNIPGNVEAVGEDYPWTALPKPDAMSAKLLEFIAAKDTWPQLGQALRKRYEVMFTQEAMVDNTEQFYFSLLETSK